MSKPWHSGHTLSDHVDPSHPQWARPLERRLELFGDFDYRAAFGEDCTLDLVKYTTFTAPCGCSLSYVWRRDHDASIRVHLPMHSHDHCAEHVHHKGDVKAHFDALMGK